MWWMKTSWCLQVIIWFNNVRNHRQNSLKDGVRFIHHPMRSRWDIWSQSAIKVPGFGLRAFTALGLSNWQKTACYPKLRHLKLEAFMLGRCLKGDTAADQPVIRFLTERMQTENTHIITGRVIHTVWAQKWNIVAEQIITDRLFPYLLNSSELTNKYQNTSETYSGKHCIM